MASALSLGFGVQGVCLAIMRDGLWGGGGGACSLYLDHC